MTGERRKNGEFKRFQPEIPAGNIK